MEDPLDQGDPYQRHGADLPGKRYTDRAHLATPVVWAFVALYALFFLGSLVAAVWILVSAGQGNGAANILLGMALFLAIVAIVPFLQARQIMRRYLDIGSGLPAKPKRGRRRIR